MHLAVKQTIEQCREMKLPPVPSLIHRERETRPSKSVRFDQVEVEKALEEIRPDVTATIVDPRGNARLLHIEILVTHGISEEKTNLYKRMHQSAIEIDASWLPRNTTRVAIHKPIVEEIKHKRWIHNEIAHRQYKDAVSRCVERELVPSYEGYTMLVKCPLPRMAATYVWDGRKYYTGKLRLYECLICKHCIGFGEFDGRNMQHIHDYQGEITHVFCGAT